SKSLNEDPLEGKSGASSRVKKLVVKPCDGSPGPPSVSIGQLVSSVRDMLLALTGQDFDPLVLAFGIGVMINRDSR
ncbi:unnamed protein product, partial [Brassica rapa subsp. trilocularis]